MLEVHVCDRCEVIEIFKVEAGLTIESLKVVMAELEKEYPDTLVSFDGKEICIEY